MGMSNELDKGQGVDNIDATHKMMKQVPEAALPEAPAPTSSPGIFQGQTTSGEGMIAGAVTPASVPVSIPANIKVGHNFSLVSGHIVCTSLVAAITLEKDIVVTVDGPNATPENCWSGQFPKHPSR
jgi:hypothetical protein